MRLGSRSLIIPVVLASFGLTASAVPGSTWPTTAMLSLGSGVAAVSLMALAAVLGARWKAVESLFGGLDRVYETHKWLGVWALVFASVHLVFKAGTPEWQTAVILPLPGAATRLVRQLSFVSLMLIVLLALNRKIPYRTWRWWNKLSGPLFLIVIAHWASFKSPIVLASPAGAWLAVLSLLGVMGAAYVQMFLYIDPNIAYGPGISIEALLVPIIGGLGTVFGPLLGAFALQGIAEIGRAAFGEAVGLNLVLYGVLLVVMVLFLPNGLFGLGRVGLRRLLKGGARA